MRGPSRRAFADPALGEQLAAAQYDGGADVVFHAAGKTGDGVFAAARERGARAIGVDLDQFSRAPCCVVTSMVKGVDVAVVDVIKDVVAGHFHSGLHDLGLAEHGVGFVADERNRALLPLDVVVLRARRLSDDIIAGPHPGAGAMTAAAMTVTSFAIEIAETVDKAYGAEPPRCAARDDRGARGDRARARRRERRGQEHAGASMIGGVAPRGCGGALVIGGVARAIELARWDCARGARGRHRARAAARRVGGRAIGRRERGARPPSRCAGRCSSRSTRPRVGAARALGDRIGLPGVDPWARASMRHVARRGGSARRSWRRCTAGRARACSLLDEPTAVLAPVEVDGLLATLRALAQRPA